ncbi:MULTISPECIES: ABC transporter ATP-binding protein [Paenibacillus]|uniref:ABC transporter ATP-binding protein n=1 Tax=Paenibacillus residui TaxID=629724 RepID=A0ABW3D7P3_9BACL|nr:MULTISPECIES: ABC transporter ATP-binding protein [Paenibacillaceae]
METVIRLDKVSKRYGSTLAVGDVSLQIGKGEIFGIVGPNGAGKTTLIEMMEGLRSADSGTVKVLNKDIRSHSQQIKERIGVLLQSTSIPGNARVKEILNVFSSFYDRTADLEGIIRLLGLGDRLNSYFKSLSGGWKQRVSLALALINDPDIVFLDEPSMGLDPVARNQMWQMIKQLREEGRTIVVTTHYMEEAETLCDRVAVMSRGSLIALDTPENLIALLGEGKRISFRNPGRTSQKAMAELTNVVHVEWESGIIKLHSTDMDLTLQHLYRRADEEKWVVRGLKLEEMSMNEVFSELTEKQGRGA